MSYLKTEEIVMADSPKYALGWQLVLHTRIIIFDTKAPRFSIDFATQSVTEHLCYIIPAMHFYCIDPMCKIRFLCIDIPHSLLKDEDLELLLLFKTQKQKSITFLDPKIFSYQVLKSFIGGHYDNLFLFRLFQYHLQQHNVWTQQIKPQHPDYYALCLQFLKTVIAQEGRLKFYNLGHIALLMGCSERAINRACICILGINPKDILQQFVLQNCLFQIGRPNIPFSAIAKEIGFSDTSSMAKFVKRVLGKTPSQIRKQIIENSIARN